MSWVCACLLVGLSTALDDPPPSHPATTASANTHLWNATWTDHLKHDLLMKYDKFARPAQQTNVTEVWLKLRILHVDVDEERSLMVLNAWIDMMLFKALIHQRYGPCRSHYISKQLLSLPGSWTPRWDDEKLKWNESDYEGLKKLNFADHEVWHPEIVLYNSAMQNSVDHFGNGYNTVSSTGRVVWVPPSMFTVYCDINVRKWPYDQHTCYFLIGSRVYDGEQLIVKPRTPPVMVEWWAKPAWRWKVLSAKAIVRVRNDTGCSVPYYSFDVAVTVERWHKAYAAVVFIPAMVCVVLTLAVFWLPPHASEKFLLAGLTTVIECMVLLFFAQRMPSMGQHTPLLVEFYGYSLALVSLSVAMSVLTGNLSRHPMPRPVPRLISKMLNRYTVFFSTSNNENVFLWVYGRQGYEELHECSLVGRGPTESVDTIHQPTLAQNERKWILLALALDRVMFILYVVIFLLITAAFYIS